MTDDATETPNAHASEPHRGGLSQRLNWLRAGVLGANDGIVSVAAVVVGVASATGSVAAILTAGLAALVVAIIQGSTWGWASPRILALLALTVLLIAMVARRIATHPSPIVEPALLKVRAFSLATLGSLLFFMAFAGMLLASVLFLTGVWHREIITAGLEIFPGPAMAAAMAVPGARLGSRFSPGRVGALGAVLFALGGVWWVGHLSGTEHYATAFLPGMLIGGIGVGFMIPSLTGAVAATLAPERLATGIAVQSTGRQIGSALGFAILVAVLGTPHTASDFTDGWKFMIVASLLSGITLAAIGRAAAPAGASSLSETSLALEHR